MHPYILQGRIIQGLALKIIEYPFTAIYLKPSSLLPPHFVPRSRRSIELFDERHPMLVKSRRREKDRKEIASRGAGTRKDPAITTLEPIDAFELSNSNAFGSSDLLCRISSACPFVSRMPRLFCERVLEGRTLLPESAARLSCLGRASSASGTRLASFQNSRDAIVPRSCTSATPQCPLKFKAASDLRFVQIERMNARMHRRADDFF